MLQGPFVDFFIYHGDSSPHRDRYVLLLRFRFRFRFRCIFVFSACNSSLVFSFHHSLFSSLDRLKRVFVPPSRDHGRIPLADQLKCDNQPCNRPTNQEPLCRILNLPRCPSRHEPNTTNPHFPPQKSGIGRPREEGRK